MYPAVIVIKTDFFSENVESQVKICQDLKPFREVNYLDMELEEIQTLDENQGLDENDNVIEKNDFEEVATILEPFSPMERLNILKLFYFTTVLF